MVRDWAAEKGIGEKSGIRWRSREASRLEGFSDGVFAFAITLLVVSLDAPRTYGEMVSVLMAFPAFAASFGIFMLIWYSHYVFFRRYGLRDLTTIVLNTALLFVVVFYVYPLKFLFNWLWTALRQGASARVAVDGAWVPIIEADQIAGLMTIYAIGFFAIFLIYAALNFHAYRRREVLELTPVEVVETKAAVTAHLLSCGIALISILLANALGRLGPMFAGFFYCMMGPVHYLHGRRVDRMRRRLSEE